MGRLGPRYRDPRAALVLVFVVACVAGPGNPREQTPAPSADQVVVLPEHADTFVRMVARGVAAGFSIEGARPASREWIGSRGAALYRHAIEEADVYLAAEPGSRTVEDFVRYPRRPSLERITYRIDLERVAGVRWVAGVLEMLDEAGAPRIRMAPPFVADRRGRRSSIGSELRGCSFDANPAPPWDRPVTPPRASTCELDLHWHLGEDDYPATVDPAWIFGSDMTMPRGFHASAALPNGRVLVIGGGRSMVPVGEVFDPKTSSWAATNATNAADVMLRIATLTDGKVLVAGGTDITLHQRYDGAALYDPDLGTWAPVQALPRGRAGHSLTPLPGGRALLAGGFLVEDVTAEALVFDPLTKSWDPAAPMLTARGHHGAIPLANGRVLATGGERCCVTLAYEALATTEIYDPVANAWTSGPTMKNARYDHTVTALPDGRVFAVGGTKDFFSAGVLGSVERLDAAGGTWTLIGSLSIPRVFHTTTLLPNGKLLVTGATGNSFAEGTVALAETIDPATDTITPADNTKAYRSAHVAERLPDGRVLVAGGGINSPVRTTEIFGTAIDAGCAGPTECLNGACVTGVCCAMESACPLAADAGGDARPPVDGEEADASPDATPAPTPAESTSYHACSASRGRGGASSESAIVLAACAGLGLRRRRILSQARRAPT